MAPIRYRVSLLLALAWGSDSALLTVYPEVILGPGLPSLASLNLTSPQRYNEARSE